MRCRAAQAGLGYAPGEVGGGLAGVLSQSGAFGSQYQVAPSWMRGAVAGGDGASYASAGYGASAGPPLGLTGAGKPYGLRAGTDIRQDGAGFPDWVYQLGDAFGVDASTYSGHQEGRGVNQGIDWWPDGNAQMYPGATGYSASELSRMDGFAEWLGTQPGVEQVIWQNPATGQNVGFADGQRVGPERISPATTAGTGVPIRGIFTPGSVPPRVLGAGRRHFLRWAACPVAVGHWAFLVLACLAD